MDNQFDNECIYEPPDFNKEYYCSPITKSSGFTLLMKWLFLIKKHIHLKDKFKNMLKRRPYLINQTNKKGWSLLILACRNSKTYDLEDIVKFLLESGIDINLKTDDGWTALASSVRNSVTDSTELTVKMLLDFEADINIKNNEGKTSIMLASMYSNQGSSKYTVKMLLDAGAAVNMQDNEGLTALINSCRFLNLTSTETIKMLLDANADINIQTTQGRLTALMNCSFSGAPLNIIKMLFKKSPNLSLHSSSNLRAFDYFYKYNRNKEVLKLFVENDEILNF